MKKLILSLLTIAALTACGDKAENEVQEGTKPVIKIGATLPLTGDLAYAGQNMKAAMELSLKDIQKKEKLKYDYQLVFEDDGYELKKALQNLNRFNVCVFWRVGWGCWFFGVC